MGASEGANPIFYPNVLVQSSAGRQGPAAGQTLQRQGGQPGEARAILKIKNKEIIPTKKKTEK